MNTRWNAWMERGAERSSLEAAVAVDGVLVVSP